MNLIALLCLMVVISASALVEGRKMPKEDLSTACESKDEMLDCRKGCELDRQCKDDTNLNCANMCRRACSLTNERGRCKAALISAILKRRDSKLDDEIARKKNKRNKVQAAAPSPSSNTPNQPSGGDVIKGGKAREDGIEGNEAKEGEVPADEQSGEAPKGIASSFLPAAGQAAQMLPGLAQGVPVFDNAAQSMANAWSPDGADSQSGDSVPEWAKPLSAMRAAMTRNGTDGSEAQQEGEQLSTEAPAM